MDKVYLVHYHNIDIDHIDKAFSSKEKAEVYIKEKYAWKEQLKQETGLDYDEWLTEVRHVKWKPISNKMQNWLDKHDIEDDVTYYICEIDVE